MDLATRLRQLFGRHPASGAALPDIGAPDPFGPDFERKIEMLARLSRRANHQWFRAERRDKRRGSGVEFSEFRDYVPGDDFRFVDPHAAMRFDRLLLRQYEEEEDPSIYILIDTSLSMGQYHRRKLDGAKRLAAAIAYLGLSALSRVTVVGLAEDRNCMHPTTRGRGQFPSIMQFLRNLLPGGGTCLEVVSKRFVNQHRRRGLAVLLSDLFDPVGFERGLDVLRYEGFEPYVLHLTDAHELDPRLTGDVTVVDCETGVEQLVTITPALRAQLAKAERDFVQRADRHCRSHGLGYLACDVWTPFDQTMLHLLGQDGRLGK